MGAHQPPLARYAARYLREGLESRLVTKKPLFLTVFVTARCGLSCGHCFYRDELLAGTAKDELTLAEWDRFTSKCPPFPKLIVTGGEPFLRADLADIVTRFYENASRARQITIPTAGAHTDRVVDLVERLLPARPDLILELQLSIDGVGEDHDAIRGKGSFEKLMRTYRALRPIQDANAGLRIRFNYTFSRKTQDHFVRTFDFVTKELGNPHFDMVLVRRATIDDDFWGQVDVDKYRRATDLLQSAELAKADSPLKRMLAQRVVVEREIIAEHHQGRRVMEGCQAGTLTAIVGETGDVRPCEILDTTFGNLREVDYDFMALWTNERAEAHRRFVAETKCFCTFETCVRTTMSFQPKWYGRMARKAVGL
ncbi:MAG: radical SAM/SPASM domain-containing protein [Myxococcota bacterium]